MKLAVYSKNGEKKEDLTLSKIFDVSIKSKTLTLYINYLRSALRAPVANTKNRGEVSGGGRKPWKQKGTGNARAGSTRSPLWVGGGVTFGPTNERNFHKRINSKERKRIILGLISELAKEKKLSIIDEIKAETPKTKEAVLILNNLKAEGKIAVIVNSDDQNADKAFRNIAGIKVMSPFKLDVPYLLSSDKVVASKSAIKEIENIFGGKSKEAANNKQTNE